MAQITTLNPANGEVFDPIDRMTPSQIDKRLTNAQMTARKWRDTTFEERSELLQRVAMRLRNEQEMLARLAVQEMGKPIRQARAEVEKCAVCCDYFAEHGPAMLMQQDLPSNARRSYVAFRPLGTVFAIMPWNFPYWQAFRAIVPALLAGNTVVLKHADNTTRCALEIERIISHAGDEGLLQTLLISHDDADALIADPRIAAVTLTGSDRAGVAVASAAGASLKNVLELGGSDAFVVLPDADIERSVKTGVRSRFQNNGQSCIAAKRFIVDASVYDEWIDGFILEVQKLRIGDPMQDETDIGPLVHADARKKLHEQVMQTVSAGASLRVGGRFIDEDNAHAGLDSRGSYYEPTVVANVRPGMPMFDEETFGPAAAMICATDEEDALRLANATSFGLGGNIWTRDIERAQRFAARLDSGNAFINDMVASDPRLPFGGVKRSGYGRELSAFGLHEFVNIQTVYIG